MLPIGIHPNLPSEQYHQRKLGVVSKSALDQINRTPAHYRAWLDGRVVKDSPALTFGRALHCATFEPDDFSKRYAAEPDFGDCRATESTSKEQAKENKLRRNAWRAEHEGFEFVSANDMRDLLGMQASIRKHELARKMLSGGLGEVTISWQDVDTGLHCKSRADYWVERHALTADLKSCDDASPDAFKKSIARYRYFVQDALYRDGFAAVGKGINHFMFIAVESSAPYMSAIYTLDAAGIATGHAAARRNIQTLAECVEKNEWPGYPAGIETLSLPPWAA